AATASEPVGVVVGDEELLVERAVARLVAVAVADTGAGVREVAAGSLNPGGLASLPSPSLFDAPPLVVITRAQEPGTGGGKEVAEELAAVVASPPADVRIVVTHAGGAKGKALLTSLTRSGAQVVDCPKITRIGDRMTFVREEFRAAHRRIDDSGVRALIDA